MSDRTTRLLDAAQKARDQALQARRLATSQTSEDIVRTLNAYAEKLDGDAFAFERQAAQLRDTVSNTTRLTAEVRALAEKAQTQMQNTLGTIKKER